MRPVRGGGGAATELMAAGGGGGARTGLWRTPTPYLFLGFLLIMGLIVLALLVLVCTRRMHHSSSPSRREEEAENEKAASLRGVLVPLDREAPRVVVIMAGDAIPSFLASAKPLAFAAPLSRAEAAV